MIKRMCEHSENESWKMEKERHDKLQLYPKENLKGRMKYLHNSETNKIFCRLRISDTRRKTGQETDTCNGCKEKVDVIQHVLEGCPRRSHERKTEPFRIPTSSKREKDAKIREILGENTNASRISQLYKEWTEDGNREMKEN